MEQYHLASLCQWKKQQMVKLMEVSDLTEQLAQAVERRDQASISMLLSMREEPIRQLQEIETSIQEYLPTLPSEEAIRCAELLKGEAAQTPGEEPLALQVAQDRRLLEQIQKLDEKTSVTLGGKQSFYRKYRA